MTGRAALVVAAGLALVGCGGRATAIALPAGSRVLARGSLAYAVAFADHDRVVSVELEERFALVVRTADGRLRGRFDLGPAERDLGALAVGGDTAWVGGADRRVRGLALADGRSVATWPIGARVTALATLPDGRLAIADADGGLCLRRLDDGALLQCVQLGDRPVTALDPRGAVLVATVAGRRLGLALPGLALVPAPAEPQRIERRGRDLRLDGGPVIRLGGAVQAVAVDGRGRIAIAAWIAGLDDPSVVLVPARSR